jgi:hypothetical protein
MALVDIFTQVLGNLQTLIPSLSLTPMIGLGSRRAQLAPPVVVWVPGSDGYEVGGEQHTGTNKAAPPVIAMRLAGVDVHIWGAVAPGASEDYSAGESLIAAVITALRTSLRARDLVINSGRWEDKEEGNDFTALGRAYILSISIRIPILQQATAIGASTVVTSVSANTITVFPDGTTSP